MGRITTRDLRVKQVTATQQQGRVRTYRNIAPAAGAGSLSFSDRFPDGAWRGRRCFIVGGGPSLKGFDFNRLKGEKVIAVNKAYFDVPFADIMFAMDRPLLNLITEGKLNKDGKDYRAAFASFAGAKLWLDLSGYSYPPGIYSVRSAGEIGWTKSFAEGLYHGQNSGYGALGLAIVLGADPIYLLGYDCSNGPDGEKHYHDGYPGAGNPNANGRFLKSFNAGAELLKDGPRIINLNPYSALRAFPFGDVDEVVAKRDDELFFDGCLGFGDNFQERPLIRHFLKKYKAVYVKTALPEVFWDLGPNVKFVNPGQINLRTQKKHMASLPPETWSPAPPAARKARWAIYPPNGISFPKVDPHPNELTGSRPLSVAGNIKQMAGIDDYDFSFPVRNAWIKAAREVTGALPIKWKKICIVRPPTNRKEWNCPSRNPKIEYMQLLIDRYKDEYFFISIADVDGEVETWDGRLTGIDAEFHHGEIPLTTIFGLMKIADMSIIYPGFFMPAAIAMRAKCFTIFGGNAGPQVHVDPIMGLDNFGWIAPEPFCQCIDNNHDCKKDIPPGKVIAAFEELKNRPLKIKEASIGIPPGIGDAHWPLLILESFKERHGLDRVTIKFFELWEYTSEFLRNVPFVDDVQKCPPLAFSFHLAGGHGKPLYKGEQHGLDYMIEYGSQLEQGVPLEKILPEYEVNWSYPILNLEKHDEFVADLRKQAGGRLVIIYTSSKGGNRAWAKNDWTLKDWMTLVEMFNQANGCKVVLIGAAFDKDYAAELKALDKGGIIIDLVGQLSIMKSLAVIKAADFFIGFSCGLELMACHFHTPCAEFWPIRKVSQGGVYGSGFMTSWLPPWSRDSDTYLPIPYGPESRPELIFPKVRKFL